MTSNPNDLSVRNRGRLLPAVISLILAGAAANVSALELGNATVRSAIGERLVVEIPISNAGAAQSSCFIPQLSGITGFGTLRLAQRSNALILRTTRVIREPMVDLQINVNCPNVPRLQRNYTLFIDPAQRMSAEQRTLSSPAAEVRVAVNRTPARRQPARPLPTSTPARAIDGKTYVVQRGDSVSAIALRIKSPDQDMWAVVDDIVGANPNAFVNGNPDLLLAGALLALPTTAALASTEVSTVTSTPPEFTPPAGPAPAASEPVLETAATPAADAPEPQSSTSATTRQTEALLSVLRDAGSLESSTQTTVDEALSDSPFKALPETPTTQATAPTPVETPAVATAATPTSSWLDRFVALALGMAGAIALWMLWQIAAGASARKRRAQGVAAASPVRSTPTAAPVARRATVEPTPWRAPVDPTHKPDVGIEVTRLDIDFGDAPQAQLTPVDIDLGSTAEMPSDDVAMSDTGNDTMPQFAAPDEADIIENTQSRELAALDEETQQLLEKDYEEQLTRTQQLSRDIAAKALGIPRAGDRSATEQLPQLDVDPYVDDDKTLNQSVIIEAPGFESPYEEDITITANMSLDLDLDEEDFDEVSGLLRSPADDLVIDAEFDYDDEDLDHDHDKTTKLTRKASSQ
ncbi:MAG: hypothetical protein AAF004_11415 [Pseudomonadota bacterium]